MAREVELKAHVTEPQVMRQRIMALHGISGERAEHKDDIYFSLPQGEPLFRLRLEGEHTVLTRKEKTMDSSGVEVNHELEFTSSADNFDICVEFFTSLGYVEYVRKQKNGWIWKFQDMTIELIEVSLLGWFVEIEILLETEGSSNKIAEARTKLLALLETLRIPRESIEKRYYMDMIKALQSNR